MTEPMTAARFEALAQAWGGDLCRWPPEARAAAQPLLDRQPALRAVLNDAAALDALLGAYSVPAPAPRLAQAVLGAAPRHRPMHRRWHRLFAGGWPGGPAGIAGMGLAGAVAGALAVALALGAALPGARALRAESGWAATGFEPAPAGLGDNSEGAEE